MIMKIFINFKFILCTLVVSSTCQDVLQWQKINTTGITPNARKDAAIGFDLMRDRMVLFGGRSNNYVFSDTWILDLKTAKWRKTNDTIINFKLIPGTKFGTTYGTNGNHFIIAFGNVATSNAPSDGVYQFDFNSETWRRLDKNTNPGGPEKRHSANGGVFGGYLYVSHGFGESKLLSDVLKFDIKKRGWEKLHEGGSQYSPVLPHARYAQAAVVLPNEKMIIFGGCLSGKKSAGPCPSKDSWLFDINTKTWTQLESCPNARLSSAMSLLPNSSAASAIAVLFGGDATSHQVIKINEQELTSEIATFDTIENKWVYRTVLKDPVSGFPQRRFGHSLATTTYGIVLYGGTSLSDGRLLNDVWLLKGDTNSVRNSPIPRKECGNNINLIILHGIFMFIAFGILMQLSAFAARYMRQKETWFHMHRIFAITGIAFAIVGFGLGVASFKGSHFSFVHGAIGLDIMLAILYQPLNAACRPAPPKDGEKPKLWRRIWELSHKFTGRIALVLAVINISLGLFLSVASESVWITWFAYLGMIVIIYVIAEVKLRMKMKSMVITGVGNENIPM